MSEVASCLRICIRHGLFEIYSSWTCRKIKNEAAKIIYSAIMMNCCCVERQKKLALNGDTMTVSQTDE